MEYLAGAILAIVIGFLAGLSHFDKDKSFYPTVLIVIALLYILFAKISNDTAALLQESFAALPFLVIAIIGFKYSAWLIVAGLLAHGIFDLIHERFIFNSGVPEWWPGFCLAIDVILGLWLAILIKTRSNNSLQPLVKSGG